MQRLDSEHHSFIIFRAAKRVAMLAAILFAAVAFARAADGPQVFTDKTSYNVGEGVGVEVTLEPGQPRDPNAEYGVTFRYIGSPKLVGGPVYPMDMPVWPTLTSDRPTDYHAGWKIPLGAQTGRYEAGLVRCKGWPPSCEDKPVATTSFSVYRKLVQIEQIEFAHASYAAGDQSFYNSGDPIICGVKISNLTTEPLTGLRVEFSDRYWPWIGTPTANVAASIKSPTS